jgi:hypothetical protein
MQDKARAGSVAAAREANEGCYSRFRGGLLSQHTSVAFNGAIPLV